MKSGNLNFLEPFGPVQACNGTDLPLPFYLGHLSYGGYYIYHRIFADPPTVIRFFVVFLSPSRKLT